MKFFRELQERRRQKAIERAGRARELARIEEEKESERRQIPEVHNKTLEILAEGKLPFVPIEDRSVLPVRLSKSEVVLGIFEGCKYLDTFIKKEWVGRSSGISVRVAKGVSVRTGGSRGTPVEQEITRDYGVGTFLITQKALYFKNGTKALRAPMNKILSCEIIDGGISFVRDRARPLPEYLLFGDLLWFPEYLQQALAYLPDVPTSASKEINLVDFDCWVLGEGIVEKDFGEDIG